MERLYCQGVVAKGYGQHGRGLHQMVRLYDKGLRPKGIIGEGRMAVKGFNARGVSIAVCP